MLGEYKGLKYIYKKHKPLWQMPLLRLLLKIGAALRVLLFGIILRDETGRPAWAGSGFGGGEGRSRSRSF